MKHIIKKIKKYSMNPGQFERMVKGQDGKCLICKGDWGNLLNVDHNHVTGEIRGLLCYRCNKGIGHFGDDIEILKIAITYLSL